MPEFTAAAVQTVAANQNAHFPEPPVGCNRGYVTHREGSGLVTLRGITNQCRARYKVTFGGNIAVPTGGTAGAISVALAINGEALNSAVATVTPAAVEEYFNVFSTAYINVDKGCCVSLSVRNVSAQAINCLLYTSPSPRDTR